jgi:hypothetical protein
MDNSTVVGDNVSVFSVPLKERPGTPSQQPLNPRVYAASRTDLPVRTGSPLARPSDDYFTRTPSRGTYRETAPGYTPAYAPSDVYEMNALTTYDSRDGSDRAALLREQNRTPPSSRGASRGPYE